MTSSSLLLLLLVSLLLCVSPSRDGASYNHTQKISSTNKCMFFFFVLCVLILLLWPLIEILLFVCSPMKVKHVINLIGSRSSREQRRFHWKKIYQYSKYWYIVLQLLVENSTVIVWVASEEKKKRENCVCVLFYMVCCSILGFYRQRKWYCFHFNRCLQYFLCHFFLVYFCSCAKFTNSTIWPNSEEALNVIF